MKLELVYPAIRITDPDKGIAIADNVRATKTRYIVDPKFVRILSGKILFGSGVRSYHKHSGREVGMRSRTWRVTREIDESFHEQSEGTPCESSTETK